MAEASNYVTVARVGEVAEGRAIPVKVDGRAIAVVLDEGIYYAIDDQCPHKGVPLCDGFVFGGTITCLWHGWRFKLADGRWMDSPRVRIGTYPVRIVGDEIQVSID
ncbi:Rieske 2Fe-2S domain-containing protein [Isosphaeraceae bacterium EP7]